MGHLELVAAGGTVVERRVVRRLTQAAIAGAIGELTPAELRVLSLMAEGHSNAAIAEELVVSRRTVENQIRIVFSKLRLSALDDVDRRVRAVLAYLSSAAAR